MFVGGALSRATVLALGIMPYISASIMFQLLAAVFPTVEKMQKEGEEGRKKLTQWTRYATVGLALLQAYGYAVFLQQLSPGGAAAIVANPGFVFMIGTTLILTIGRGLRHVAGRADHRAGHRQRHEPAHLLLHHRGLPVGLADVGVVHHGRDRGLRPARGHGAR